MLNPIIRQSYEQLLIRRNSEPVASWPDEHRAILRQTALALAAAQETPFFPPILYIEPTNACNCNCVICPRQHMSRAVGLMDMELFRSIVSQAAELGPSELRLFNFGEPTMHPALPAMIEFCASLRMNARFQSNGLLLKPQLIERLLDTGLNYYGISVNGLTAEDYSKIRPGFQLAELLSNIQALRQAAAKRNMPIHVHINAQVTRPDTENRPQDVDTFKKTWFHLADSISITGLNYYDEISIVSSGEIEQKINAEMARKPDAKVVCTEPFDRMVIKWDGDVTACCPDFDGREIVGSLANQKLEAIWSGQPMERIRQALRNKRYDLIATCKTCPKFYSDEFTILFKKS